jgi:hypothetical protein
LRRRQITAKTIWSNAGQALVKRWSNAGQTLVERWSNAGRRRRQITAKTERNTAREREVESLFSADKDRLDKVRAPKSGQTPVADRSNACQTLVKVGCWI